MTRIKDFSLLLIVSCTAMIASCSASINPMYGKHKDDPQAFVDRRPLPENIFIADGGYKKKSNQTIIPSSGDVIVGNADSVTTKSGDDTDQTTYTYNKLSENSPPSDEGFSRRRLNVSTPQDSPSSNAVSFSERPDILFMACADQKMQKEIDEAAISKEEFERAKEREVQLS